jgi:hypothetical protein
LKVGRIYVLSEKITFIFMKKIFQILLFISAAAFITSCSTSKNTTNLKPTTGHLSGTWTISDISLDVPSGFQVTNVFDEAPYTEFKGSTWDLIRNGKGTFTLTNGTKEDIYWSIYGKGDNAQFQFKKLNGQKAKNVEEGYRLTLGPISSNSFTAKSTIDVGNANTGSITYTFTKQ